MSDIEQWIRSKVGCGYVYGATGWVCTPKRRQQQAEQYPEYADNILGICAKWDGKECYDCAQLIRRALESVGVTGVPSGATSQWNKKSLWSESGTIDTLPPDGLVALCREENGRMQHIGWRMSDGSVIDARSSSKGVIVSHPEDYRWSHWMRPVIGSNERNDTDMSILYTAKVKLNDVDSYLNVRNAPNGDVIGKLHHDAPVEVWAEKDDWAFIHYGDSGTGYVSAKYLVQYEPAETAPSVATTTLANADGMTVTLMGEWRVMENG